MEKTVNTMELVNILKARKGSSFIGLQLETPVKMNKKHRETKQVNPYDGLTKDAKVFARVTFDYDASVERRGGELPEEPKKEAWHRPIFNEAGGYTPLACHAQDESRVYLRFEEIRSESVYKLGEETIEKEEVYPYLPPYKADNRVMEFRLASLDNIKELRIDGVTYKIAK